MDQTYAGLKQEIGPSDVLTDAPKAAPSTLLRSFSITPPGTVRRTRSSLQTRNSRHGFYSISKGRKCEAGGCYATIAYRSSQICLLLQQMLEQCLPGSSAHLL